MDSIGRSAALALILALGACGGGDETAEPQEPVAGDTPVVAPSETPVAEETPPASDETPAPAPTAEPTVAAAAGVSAPASFNQCKVCHAVEPGKHGIGPSLAGIYGTRAGDIPGFQFSTAMIESGLTWDEATLDKYLTDPRALVPGTKMSFAGLKDAAKRKEVIDYLKSL